MSLNLVAFAFIFVELKPSFGDSFCLIHEFRHTTQVVNHGLTVSAVQPGMGNRSKRQL